MKRKLNDIISIVAVVIASLGLIFSISNQIKIDKNDYMQQAISFRPHVIFNGEPTIDSMIVIGKNSNNTFKGHYRFDINIPIKNIGNTNGHMISIVYCLKDTSDILENIIINGTLVNDTLPFSGANFYKKILRQNEDDTLTFGGYHYHKGMTPLNLILLLTYSNEYNNIFTSTFFCSFDYKFDTDNYTIDSDRNIIIPTKDINLIMKHEYSSIHTKNNASKFISFFNQKDFPTLLE